uniref:DUF3615 domain-containing protein n=1 Tax=Oryza glumipatula TaxID=40148 RepID=A0A0E0AX23_9ORYZ
MFNFRCREEEEEEHGAETASAETLGLHQHLHPDHSGPLCAEKGHADAASAQTLLEVSSMISDSSSSSQPKAVAVAQDTIEFSEPSGRCLSLSPVSRIWSQLMRQWGLTFYIRVDLQGSFHTYPDLGGPFRKLTMLSIAILKAAGIQNCKVPQLWLKQDGVSDMDIIVRQSIYWPDGSIKKRTKSYATEKTHKRMCQLVQALVDKYNEDHNLFGDLAHMLQDVLHYQSVRDKFMGYYHLNFTTKTKEADDLDAGIDNLFFVEIKRSGRGKHKEMLVNCFCMYVVLTNLSLDIIVNVFLAVVYDEDKICYGCANQGSVDMKHPDPCKYDGGHLDMGRPFECVKAKEAKIRRMYEQADEVAQDTEVWPPSASCLSSSPASRVWARHVKDWGRIFYIRVDLQGSFHTYPDVGGPFQSSQETDKAIDRYLEDHWDPKMRMGPDDNVSIMDKVIRRCLYWPDGRIKRHTKSSSTRAANKRMHQFIQALVDKYNDDHNLLGDLALKLKDVLHYQPICENHIWYYHLNFTAKTKEADGLDSTSDNLFFVEVKRMGIGNYEEMLVSCFFMVNPDNGKPCKGCTNNGTVDMKHPDTDEYFAGHLDAYLPFGCFGKWSDSDDDDKYVKAREAKLRHMYEGERRGGGEIIRPQMVVVSGESVTIHYHSQLPCGSLKK